MRIEVRTQAELDAALKSASDADVIVCRGDGGFVLWDNAHAELRDNAHAVLWDNAHAELWDNAHAELRDNAHAELRDNAHAELRDNAHAVLWDNAHAVLWDNAHAEASQWAAVHKMSPAAVVRGGVVIKPPRITSADLWLEYHGVPVKRGIAVLYKAVDDAYHAAHALPDGTMPDYAPGSKPEAPDFDPAPRDCGKGLHGCPSPSRARQYKLDATKYVAIPVRVKDMGAPDPDGDTGKIRFRCAAKPVYEVDIYGEPVVREDS